MVSFVVISFGGVVSGNDVLRVETAHGHILVFEHLGWSFKHKLILVGRQGVVNEGSLRFRWAVFNLLCFFLLSFLAHPELGLVWVSERAGA